MVHKKGRLETYFMSESPQDFYLHPEVKDVSFPVYPVEVVLPENPKSHSKIEIWVPV